MKHQILVVDDDITGRKLLEALLKSNGYDVLLAEDGPQAIEQCEQEIPDLMLLDVSMPGMSGHEVAVRVKAGAATQDIPIIMLTAFDDQEQVAQAHENGAIDYVVKPFDTLDLLGKIKRAVS